MCLYKNKNEIADDLGGRNGFENAGDGKFESSFRCIEDVVRAVENLEEHHDDVGDSAKLSAVASELERLEEDFSEIERVVRGYLNSSPSPSGCLNGSRTTPTGQSAIKEQSERLKEEISRREHELKQVVDILEKTYEECHKKLEERLSKEQGRSEGTRSGR